MGVVARLLALKPVAWGTISLFEKDDSLVRFGLNHTNVKNVDTGPKRHKEYVADSISRRNKTQYSQQTVGQVSGVPSWVFPALKGLLQVCGFELTCPGLRPPHFLFCPLIL